MKIITHKDGLIPHSLSAWTFVFGSNLAGRHGAGAAKIAREKFGAIYKCGFGKQGQSYAIPTKDQYLNTLPLSIINGHVALFIDYVLSNKNELFWVTRIGCGLAGYGDEDVAPMFIPVRNLCNFPEPWEKYLI